jgi:hypothetical protein
MNLHSRRLRISGGDFTLTAAPKLRVDGSAHTFLNLFGRKPDCLLSSPSAMSVSSLKTEVERRARALWAAGNRLRLRLRILAPPMNPGLDEAASSRPPNQEMDLSSVGREIRLIGEPDYWQTCAGR